MVFSMLSLKQSFHAARIFFKFQNIKKIVFRFFDLYLKDIPVLIYYNLIYQKHKYPAEQHHAINQNVFKKFL